MTPIRGRCWSVDATTLRSTQTTRTTAALSTGSVSRDGVGVRSIVAASTDGGSIVFHGLSPAAAWAAYRLAAGPVSAVSASRAARPPTTITLLACVFPPHGTQLGRLR